MWRRRLDRRCPIARRRCLPSKWAPWVEEVRPRIKLQVGPPVVAAVPLLRHRRIQVRRRRLGHRRRGPRWLIPPEARKCSSHGKGRSRLLAEKRHGQYVNCRDGRALRAAKFCQGPRWLRSSLRLDDETCSLVVALFSLISARCQRRRQSRQEGQRGVERIRTALKWKGSTTTETKTNNTESSKGPSQQGSRRRPQLGRP